MRDIVAAFMLPHFRSSIFEHVDFRPLLESYSKVRLTDFVDDSVKFEFELVVERLGALVQVDTFLSVDCC